MRAFWLVLVAASVAGCDPGRAQSGDPNNPNHVIKESEWRALNARIEKLEGHTSGIRQVVDALAEREIASSTIKLAGAMNTFYHVGHAWQVKDLILSESAQGGLVSGQILNKEYVNKLDVDFKITLLNDANNDIGSGNGQIAFASPGEYQFFSVVVRTSAKLSEAASVKVSFDDAGSTSPVFRP